MMKKKVMVQLFDNECGRGYNCVYRVDDKLSVEGKGRTVAEAVECVRDQIEGEPEFKVLYFGKADTRSVFLTREGGITSTSANYLANLAQELIQEKKMVLENTSFLNSRIVTPICPDGLEYGKANFDLGTISDTICEIGNINAFCAWAREGIKAKESALNATYAITFSKWMEAFDRKEIISPVHVMFNSEDAERKLSIGERFQMLRAEAIASAYGKFIHRDMPISEARKALEYRMLNPVEKEGSGKELTLVKYEPAITTAEVDKVFMQLQNKQREAEKVVNHYKAEMAQSCAKLNIESEKFYTDWTEEYKAVKEKLLAEYNTDMEMVREEINKLKIVVPDALKGTYQYLNNLGKN